MDTLSAFAMGETNRDKELMVFDWDLAAKLIKDSGLKEAAAGLEDDWKWTGGGIFEDGKPVPKEETYVYLASTWDKPELIIDGESIYCFKMQSETDNWNSDTYWPESALKILNEQ